MKRENKIKFYREQNKMSKNELAKIVGVSVSTLSRWEERTTSPNALQVYKICKILKVSSDDLLCVK